MPSLIHRLSVSNHVPVALSRGLPVMLLTGYNSAMPAVEFQISVRVMQPPRVMPSDDSMYSRSDSEEYRRDTVVFGLHAGLGMALFGDGVSVAPARLIARKLRTAATVRSIVC